MLGLLLKVPLVEQTVIQIGSLEIYEQANSRITTLIVGVFCPAPYMEQIRWRYERRARQAGLDNAGRTLC